MNYTGRRKNPSKSHHGWSTTIRTFHRPPLPLPVPVASRPLSSRPPPVLTKVNGRAGVRTWVAREHPNKCCGINRGGC
ncbi:hypothetical protein AALO_G00222140 [Alosa alosa]|uniref:Uncharacterized protein n=1 Tax=Alosa alosa TaxID=278164 RepID=A0AAV6G1G1_9TELE|nr:hypothetical protein AALO_G00222140 [Alosa alosa]